MTTFAHTWRLSGAEDHRSDLTDRQVYDLMYGASSNMTTTPMATLSGVADFDLVDHTLLRVEGVCGTVLEWKRESISALSMHVLLHFIPGRGQPTVNVYHRLVDAAEDAHAEAENLAANTTGEEHDARSTFARQMAEEVEDLRLLTPDALEPRAADNLPVEHHTEWNSPFGERWEAHRVEGAQAAAMLRFQALN